MKSILFTTTALVGLAGAAAADVSFGGSATLGYNDVVEDGFYWSTGLDATLSAELDYGLTASATFGIDTVDDNDLDGDVEVSGYVLSLSTDNAALNFGDVDPVAEANWSGVDGDTTSGFADQDMYFDTTTEVATGTDPDIGWGFDAILAGEAGVAGFDVKISYGVEVDGDEGTTEGNGSSTDAPIDAMQLYVSGDAGMFGMQAAYQEEFDGMDAVYGISASTSAAGADLQVSYIDDGTNSSLGVAAAYPVGAVTVSGYYSFNDPDENNWGVEAAYADGPVAVAVGYDYTGNDETGDLSLEGSYDLGNGIAISAGYIISDVSEDTSSSVYYVAGDVDLGGGATLLVSYAGEEVDSGDNDDIEGYLEGTTVELNLAF